MMVGCNTYDIAHIPIYSFSSPCYLPCPDMGFLPPSFETNHSDQVPNGISVTKLLSLSQVTSQDQFHFLETFSFLGFQESWFDCFFLPLQASPQSPGYSLLPLPYSKAGGTQSLSWILFFYWPFLQSHSYPWHQLSSLYWHVHYTIEVQETSQLSCRCQCLGPTCWCRKCEGCVHPYIPLAQPSFSSIPLYGSRSLRKPTGRHPEGEESVPLALLYSVHRAMHGAYGAKATELLPSQPECCQKGLQSLCQTLRWG